MRETGQTGIGLLNEQPLHAALKTWYAQPGARFEVEVDGFVVDIVQGDLLVEIQTGNFSAVKEKIKTLVGRHRLRLVYPVAREKWLLKLPKEGEGEARRRKSPKRGRVEEVFKELVSFPGLMHSASFSLEVLLIQEEELRRYDPTRRWRNRGWVTVERRLLDVVSRRLFETPEDIVAILPAGLPQRFTTADLARGMDGPRWLAQKTAYCLRKMGAIFEVGKRGRSKLYARGE
ncbi:MAG: hypothetical protein PVG71_12030 [Anaerolineae bacterium]|jgi:hypothetical protein